MVAEDSLRGVTANPSIFEKAILGSEDYDEYLEQRWRASSSTHSRSTSASRSRDVQLACDVLREVWDRLAPRRRLRIARGGPRHRPRPAPHDRGRARLLAACQPAEPDDQDPRARQRARRDRAGDLRGDQRQRHAAVRPRGLRGRRRRLSARGWSAGWPRARTSTSPRSRASSSRASTPPSTSGCRSSAERISMARRRSPTRGWPTGPLSGSSPAPVGTRCAAPARTCSGRCGPRPGSRTRATGTRCTSTSWSALTRSTRCRCRR